MIEAGDYVAVTGLSGSGKSTLLHLLGLLDTPTEGSYLLDGLDTSALSDRDRSALRGRRIGFVFQAFHLLPYRTALEKARDGWDRLWRTTRRVLDWLLGDGEKPAAVRLWARHLPDLRVPTRTELQLRRYLAPFWAMPAPTALHESAYQAKLSLTRSRSPAQ